MTEFFLGVLGMILVYLKLTGVLLWSWWYITLPFWGLAALTIFFLLLGVFIIWWSTQ